MIIDGWASNDVYVKNQHEKATSTYDQLSGYFGFCPMTTCDHDRTHWMRETRMKERKKAW